MLQGSVDLLNEVSTSKITGEEDTILKLISKVHKKIYELFKPELNKKR